MQALTAFSPTESFTSATVLDFHFRIAESHVSVIISHTGFIKENAYLEVTQCWLERMAANCV